LEQLSALFNWDDANRNHLARHAVTPQEAEQCYCNDPLIVNTSKTAKQQGRLRRVSQTDLPGASETVTIRIPPQELTRACMLAAKGGLRYQTYLKMLLHEALDAEEKKLAGQTAGIASRRCRGDSSFGRSSRRQERHLKELFGRRKLSR
jgi:uncharacterized DUF497 family protein